MSTEQIAEQANREIAESIGVEPPKAKPPKAKRTRKARRLTWKERQYGAGFINGLLCGIGLGLPLAMVIAAVAKWFVDWLAR